MLTFINRMLEYFGAGFVFAPLSIIVLLYLTINLNKEKAGKKRRFARCRLMGVFAQLIYSPITDIGLPGLIAVAQFLDLKGGLLLCCRLSSCLRCSPCWALRYRAYLPPSL